MNSTEGAIVDITQTYGKASFSLFDYSIFTAMLGLSAAIGIYFGCFGSKQSTAEEYLMGGKQMKVVPIALSLVASHISGITLLGVPADVYRYGAGYWLCVVSYILMIIPTVYIYLPVYFKLGITSTYEYLQMRFDNKARVLASFLFTVACFLYLPIVIYLPALALSATTGINLHLITPIVCGVCIFYTTIGGLKAVVWTDTLQFTITCGAVTAVIVLGVKAAGGLGEVWTKALENDRLNVFDFDPDLTKRDTFWGVVVGYTFYWMSFSSTNQGCVQKLLSVATLRDVKVAGLLSAIGLGVVSSASVFTGLIIYSKYSNCDPFETQQITRNDQLLPYYVLEIAGNIPGFTGLFIAGVFSAALSTLSAHLNCMSGTIYEDFISKRVSKDITEKTKSDILKFIVIVSGVICTVMVFIFEHLGGILPLAIAFNSVTNGPLLGIFTLGVLFPRVNRKGAFYGGVFGLIGVFCIIMTSQYYKSMGLLSYPQKPLGVDNCTYSFNSTVSSLGFNATHSPQVSQFQPFILFRVSYYYYTIIGLFLTMAAGLAISYVTEKDKPVSRDLFSPVIHRWLSEEDYPEQDEIQYYKVDTALKILMYGSEEDKKSIEPLEKS